MARPWLITAVLLSHTDFHKVREMHQPQSASSPSCRFEKMYQDIHIYTNLNEKPRKDAADSKSGSVCWLTRYDYWYCSLQPHAQTMVWLLPVTVAPTNPWRLWEHVKNFKIAQDRCEWYGPPVRGTDVPVRERELRQRGNRWVHQVAGTSPQVNGIPAEHIAESTIERDGTMLTCTTEMVLEVLLLPNQQFMLI